MHKLIITAILAITLAACATTQPTDPPVVMLTVDGAAEVVHVKQHPCEGNWNFCDQVMEARGETIPYHNNVPEPFESEVIIPAE